MLDLADVDHIQLRFKIGSRVEANCGEWMEGTVIAIFYTQEDFPVGKCVPYQVKLDVGDVVFAPSDDDHVIRALKRSPAPSDEAAELRRAAALIRDADAVVITAGAGMSIPAGIDYTSRKIFAERYPAMLKHGLTCCYDTFSFAGFSDKRLNWGYMCAHAVYSTSHLPKDDRTYYTLLDLVKNKPSGYFVATSNADGLFARTGFDKERIWTPQGSYDKIQCKAQPSCGHVWDSHETIAKVVANTDKETLLLDTQKCPIPTCPNCGGACGFNLNGGAYYINTHWEKDRQALQAFIQSTLDKGQKIAIVEVGISVRNTPGVLRYPMEQVLKSNRGVSLIRINPDHRTNGLSRYGAGTEPERFVALAMGADTAIAEIAAAVEKNAAVA